MLSVELTNLANMLDATKQAHNISQLAKQYSSTIKNAIWDTTIVNNIFAYETNGEYIHFPPGREKIANNEQASEVDTSWTTPTFR